MHSSVQARVGRRSQSTAQGRPFISLAASKPSPTTLPHLSVGWANCTSQGKDNFLLWLLNSETDTWELFCPQNDRWRGKKKIYNPKDRISQPEKLPSWSNVLRKPQGLASQEFIFSFFLEKQNNSTHPREMPLGKAILETEFIAPSSSTSDDYRKLAAYMGMWVWVGVGGGWGATQCLAQTSWVSQCVAKLAYLIHENLIHNLWKNQLYNLLNPQETFLQKVLILTPCFLSPPFMLWMGNVPTYIHVWILGHRRLVLLGEIMEPLECVTVLEVNPSQMWAPQTHL